MAKKVEISHTLILSVINSNCYHISHISNCQLKFKIITKHTQPRHVCTAVKLQSNCITIGLSIRSTTLKQRHCFLCNKTAGTKSQQVTSEGITSSAIKIQIGFTFEICLAGAKFSITKLFHEEQQRKAGKVVKFVRFYKEKARSSCESATIWQILWQQSLKKSCLSEFRIFRQSAKVTRRSRLSRFSCHFLLF